MFSPDQTQRFACAARTGGKRARRGYSWVSLAIMVLMFVGLVVRVIVDLCT